MIAIVIKPDGTVDPLQLGDVEVRFGLSMSCGWLCTAFVGRDLIAKAWAAMPDDAMRMVMERLAEVRGAIDGALAAIVVDMSGEGMMPTEGA